MSTRVIVKGLPSYMTQESFQKHFKSQNATITDAKLMTTLSGKSRQFGFLGFQSEREAEQCIKHFNRSFIDTSRLVVEAAHVRGDQNLPRPWSKHSSSTAIAVKSVAAAQNGNHDAEGDKLQNKSKSVAELIEEDPKLKEFLEVMKPRNQKKIWENDDVTAVNQQSTASGTDGNAAAVSKLNAIEDEYQDLPQKTVGENQQASVVLNPKVDDVQKVETQSDPKKVNDAESQISESGRLFVRNLGYQCTETQLKNYFEKFGPISEINFPIDFETKQTKGYAHITFLMPSDAVKAHKSMDGGHQFQGRLIHVLPAQPKRVLDEYDVAAMSFKQRRQQTAKSSSQQESNWNSLFMNADAVNEAMASRLNVSKSDIMDVEADNLAVRQALAETHVIQETVKYLKEQGVSVDALKATGASKIDRSDTTLMIKNIPYSTTQSEIQNLFGRYGDILRIVIPPTRTIALIEYASAQEAKNGSMSLAYKNFHGRPLMLEFAPVNTFATAADRNLTNVPQDVVDSVEASATLFVKNLNFVTSVQRLTDQFSSFSGFKSAKISMRTVAKTGMKQSMGYGFVEFDSVANAQLAMQKLQHSLLDGHALQLKFSDKSTGVQKAGQEKVSPKSTKLLVRNVPFEATRKDILELFGTFGQLKRVKLPKKHDGQHRGFAFVEFLTKQEAASAFESTKNTHLYGRHLVIEWAAEDESVDAMREKTKKQYDLTLASEAHKKRTKLELDEEDL